MSKYTFEDLSPIDFEELARDLIQKHLKITLESFAEGKDDGIDLRYSKSKGMDIIIQCKRYNKISDLKSNLRKEVKKVKLLRPKRYILVTSVSLTPKNKKDIQNTFKGVKLFLRDILGRNDINNFLGKFPEIEKQHFKLWLNSSAVLERILHSKIYNQSEFEKEIIEREIKIYVSSDANKEAVDILDKNNFVIISGIPGIGKTTLARILIYSYLIDDWELISVSKDINEADEAYEKSKYQVFYYDDFLGTNFLEDSLTKNEEKRLIRFIEKTKKSTDKKLIFTTREYILNQARQKYESLQSDSLDIAKCIIDLKKYTRLIKGRILYNHLYYSEIEQKFIDDLLKENRYLSIIKHPNYNPRLIRYLTDKDLLKSTTSNNYFNFFIEHLANPKKIWEYAYTAHISPNSRYLLLVLLSLGEPAFQEDLYNALSAFFTSNSKYYTITINMIEFKKALRECESTFLISERNDDGNIIIRFQNPSIKDFLIHYLNNETELVKHLINAAIFFNQFFDIYTTEPSNQKIFIGELTQRLLFTRLRTVFYTIKVSTLHQRYDSEKKDFLWKKVNMNYIERLRELSEFFNLTKSRNVLDYLYKEYNSINIEKEVFGSGDLNNYLTIVSSLNQYFKLDGKRIIECLFKTDNLDDFDSINEITKLEEIFPEDFENFQSDKEEEIDNIMRNVFSSELDFIRIIKDKSNISEYIDEVNNYGAKFNIDCGNYLEEADLLMEAVDKEEEDNKLVQKETNPIIPSLASDSNDEEELINIFNSLKR